MSQIKKPQPLKNPSWNDVKTMCKGHINNIADGSYHCDDDSEHYIYECVIEAIYGKKVWDWINNKIIGFQKN